MRGDRMPLFVDRQSYRRRRVADAARILPIIGGLLFFLPLLWRSPDSGEGASTAFVMAYVFGIWAVLALGAGLLARHLHQSSDPPNALNEDPEADSHDEGSEAGC